MRMSPTEKVSGRAARVPMGDAPRSQRRVMTARMRWPMRDRERRVNDGSQVRIGRVRPPSVQMSCDIVIEGQRHHQDQHRDADLLTEQLCTL